MGNLLSQLRPSPAASGSQISDRSGGARSGGARGGGACSRGIRLRLSPEVPEDASVIPEAPTGSPLAEAPAAKAPATEASMDEPDDASVVLEAAQEALLHGITMTDKVSSPAFFTVEIVLWQQCFAAHA